MLPGERGERRHRELTERGVIALDTAGWELLTSGCEALGVPLPSTVDPTRGDQAL